MTIRLNLDDYNNFSNDDIIEVVNTGFNPASRIAVIGDYVVMGGLQVGKFRIYNRDLSVVLVEKNLANTFLRGIAIDQCQIYFISTNSNQIMVECMQGNLSAPVVSSAVMTAGVLTADTVDSLFSRSQVASSTQLNASNGFIETLDTTDLKTQELSVDNVDARTVTSTTLTAQNGNINNLTVTDLTVGGDLTVSGTTTTINTTELDVEDPLLKIASGNTTNALNLGIYGQYSGSQYAGIIREPTGQFYLFNGSGTEPTPTSDVNSFNRADLFMKTLNCENVSSNLIMNGATPTIETGFVQGIQFNDLRLRNNTNTAYMDVKNNNNIEIKSNNSFMTSSGNIQLTSVNTKITSDILRLDNVNSLITTTSDTEMVSANTRITSNDNIRLTSADTLINNTNNTELTNSNTLITSTNNIELTSSNTIIASTSNIELIGSSALITSTNNIELTNNNLLVNGVTQDTEKDAFCCMSEYYGIGNEFVIGVAASTQNINMGIGLLSPVTAHNCAFTVLNGNECSMNITVSGAYDLSYFLNCTPLNDTLTVTFGLTKNGVIDDEFHRLTKSSVLRMFNRPC